MRRLEWVTQLGTGNPQEYFLTSSVIATCSSWNNIKEDISILCNSVTFGFYRFDGSLDTSFQSVSFPRGRRSLLVLSARSSRHRTFKVSVRPTLASLLGSSLTCFSRLSINGKPRKWVAGRRQLSMLTLCNRCSEMGKAVSLRFVSHFPAQMRFQSYTTYYLSSTSGMVHM